MGRYLPALLLVAMAAHSAETSRPRSYYLLEHRAQRFAEALVAGRGREVYDLFVPAFQAENSFARFDSALRAWYGGRRTSMGRARVQDIGGLGGSVATWVVFQNEIDYSYVFSSWLFTADTWQLTWVSNIIDQSFQYGRRDTTGLRRVADAALRHLVIERGLKVIHRRLPIPDTLVVVLRDIGAGSELTVPGHPVVMIDPERLRRPGRLPRVPYLFDFALIRILGDVALCAVDIRPPERDRPGMLDRRRGLQLYFRRDGDGWEFVSSGRVW
jgi:hypothetical protein